MEALSPKPPVRTIAAIQALVYGSLVRLLGRERAEVVDFFVDSRLAAVDPDRYERAVESLLGEEGGLLVLNALKSELARSARAASLWNESLLAGVRMVEKALPRPPNFG